MRTSAASKRPTALHSNGTPSASLPPTPWLPSSAADARSSLVARRLRLLVPTKKERELIEEEGLLAVKDARQLPRSRQLSEDTRLLFARTRDAVHTELDTGGLRERVNRRGAAATCESIARATTATRIRLTEAAWDRIETADPEELAFVVALASIDARPLELHEAVRAALENPMLRELED